MAGVNALGRGQDRESLTAFLQTVAQTMGPEAIAKYIDPSEVIKRLATAQGIETLGLVKSEQQLQGEMQQQQQAMQQQELLKQAGQFASSPMMDPSKNPEMTEQLDVGSNPEAEAAPPEDELT